MVYVHDREELNVFCNRLGALDGITKIERLESSEAIPCRAIPLLEQTLPSPSHDEGCTIGVRDQQIGFDCGFDVMLPHLQVGVLGLWDRFRVQGHALARNQFGFVADEADQDFGQRRQYLRQVYRLQAIPRLL